MTKKSQQKLQSFKIDAKIRFIKKILGSAYLL